MATKRGYFKVEEVAKQPIAQAVAALAEADRAQFAGIDWNKVPFDYIEHETKEAALQGYTDKELLELLNSVEKQNAKAKEYQRVTKPFRPDPSDPEVKRETMIRNFVNMGVDPETARNTVEALIASAAKDKETVTA